MPLISNIEFRSIALNHKHGLVVHVRGNLPPGPARNVAPNSRKAFWEMGKRLPFGCLVALFTKERLTPVTVNLALLTTCE